VHVADKARVAAKGTITEGKPVAAPQATQIAAGSEIDASEVPGQPYASAAELDDEGIVEAVSNNDRTIIDDARVPDPIVLQTGVIRLRESLASGVGYGTGETAGY
jgi:hypothetical protein